MPSRPRAAAPRHPAGATSVISAPAALPRGLRIVAVLAVMAAIAALVSFPLSDPDLWQHLRTGRALWESHRIEPRNVWTWPTYGEPYLIPSWLFRVLLWPFWSAGGITGLFVWRWLTTLACFAMLWAAARARRRGATGVAALFALLWCAVLYRFRSQVRPETLVAVLLAAQFWLLESRRAPRPRDASSGTSSRTFADPTWLLVPIAILWINVHLSYVLGLFVTGAYLLDEEWRARRKRPGAAPARLALVLLACVAGSFLNPYGVALLRQPFDYALTERHLPIMRMIAELGPISWPAYLSTGLPLLVALPVLLALWRWRRSGPDLAQIAILAFFISQGLSTQRFIGFTAIAIAPFFARDASEFCATRRWPAWLVRPATRLGLTAALAALLLYPAFAQRQTRPAIAFRDSTFPEAACDAIAAMGVRGRAFNLFSQGGYLLWRFWPEEGRLPFMDAHATGTREDRDGYAAALFDAGAWEALDARHHFDWVMLGRTAMSRSPLLETLDADTTRWALVFVDDVAAVFARRDGASATAAERERYLWLPAGSRRLAAVAQAMDRDSLALSGMLADLERSTRESKSSASSHLMLGNVALIQNRPAAALAHYDAVRRAEPDLPGARTRRGLALLALARPAEALEEFRAARRFDPPPAGAEFLMGRALRALGRREAARAAWRRAMALDPGLSAAGDSIAAMDRPWR